MTSQTFCPKCKSTNITINGKLLTLSPEAKICNNCGFEDTTFPVMKKIKKKLDKK